MIASLKNQGNCIKLKCENHIVQCPWPTFFKRYPIDRIQNRLDYHHIG